MPQFTVTAVEKFSIRTVYRGVEASSKEEAERKCKEGEESYDSQETLEGGEEWIETESVEKE